jgi:hypothetical protein
MNTVAASNAHVQPITRADRKRIEFFHLHVDASIPAAEAPAAPVMTSTPDDDARQPEFFGTDELIGVPAEIIEGEDSWDAWDDGQDFPWSIGPEPSSIDLTPFAPGLPADDESAVGPVVEVRVVDQPRGSIESEGPRLSWDFRAYATRWESDQAAAMFAPPARRRAYPNGTGMSDTDVHSRGIC